MVLNYRNLLLFLLKCGAWWWLRCSNEGKWAKSKRLSTI